MSNVVRFGPSTNETVESTLGHLFDEQDEVSDVLVIGYRSDGEFFVRSSRQSRETSLWLAMELLDYVRKVGRYAE